MPNENLSDLPISRKEALEQFAKFYFTGKPCRHGHLTKRRASNGGCLGCDPEHNRNNRDNDRKWKTINREKVLAGEQKSLERRRLKHDGNTRFFTGLPCARGHISERFVSDRSCAACKAENTKKWFRDNREHKKSYDKEYVARNRTTRSIYNNKWIKENPDKVSIYHRNSYVFRKGKGARKKITAAHLDLLMKSQRCKCAYCRVDIKKKYHLDHILALSKGGSHELKNWQLLCPKCNSQKGSKDAIDFAQEKGLLL